LITETPADPQLAPDRILDVPDDRRAHIHPPMPVALRPVHGLDLHHYPP